MANHDIALMAHLMRRAGFGAQYHELETLAAQGYEATVDALLNPEDQPSGLDLDLAERYFIEWSHFTRGVPEYWAWRMINSKRQLEEKMVLFWHGVLCTADSKTQSYPTSYDELEMFRRLGMGSFRDLLLEISRDPAMVFYLDNCLSHKGAINENYGRELLELFSMGVGMDGQFNYTEDDVKECARAFTGWTLANNVPGQPYGRYSARFLFNPADHDDGEKTFLGETGRFNGDDIIDIVAKQPATARFVSRHLYSYFVADEAQVPAWMDTPPRIRKPSRCSRMNTIAPVTTSAPCFGSCSTPMRSKMPGSPGSRARSKPSWAPCASSATGPAPNPALSSSSTK